MPVDNQISHGLAVYLEFRREDSRLQIMATQAMLLPGARGEIVPARLYLRPGSITNRQRMWRSVTSDAALRHALQIDGSLSRGIPGTVTAHEIIVGSLAHLRSLALGWRLTETPLVCEIGTEDARSIGEDKTPTRLLARMLRVRAEAAFPALYPDEPELLEAL